MLAYLRFQCLEGVVDKTMPDSGTLARHNLGNRGTDYPVVACFHAP